MSKFQAWRADLPDDHLLKDPRLGVVLVVLMIGIGGGLVLAQFTAGMGPVPWLGLAAVAIAVGWFGMRRVRVKYGVTGPPDSGYILDKPTD